MDREIFASERARLVRSALEGLRGEPHVVDCGALIFCRRGEADIHIEFKKWHLEKDSVITLFPNDVVYINNVSDDFEVEMLRYDKALLREASLQLEQTVYSELRKDRCRNGEAVVCGIFNGMFNLLRIYFAQDECRCKEQLVLYQLKAFFLGFYDWINRHKSTAPPETGSRRQNELFNMFMEMIESDYKISHDVAYYADKLNITPKYLLNITQSISGHTTKTIIDHYVTMQIKLELRTSDVSIKQMAWDFHFSDPSFFCRYFRHRAGMSPQEFRRKYRFSD